MVRGTCLVTTLVGVVFLDLIIISFSASSPQESFVAQRKRAGLITRRVSSNY